MTPGDIARYLGVSVVLLLVLAFWAGAALYFLREAMRVWWFLRSSWALWGRDRSRDRAVVETVLGHSVVIAFFVLQCAALHWGLWRINQCNSVPMTACIDPSYVDVPDDDR